MPQVGEIVLLKINENPQAFRPFLVTVGSTKDSDKISGILFTDTFADRQAEFIIKITPFYHSEKHSISLHNIPKGTSVGEWSE